MAFIALNELHTTGAGLFQDSESYLTELNNLDDAVHGGLLAGAATTASAGATATILGIVTKGYEFGVYTVGIEGISYLVKSFSYGGGYSSAV
ncbi:hypothetical protein [Fortiea contorta]|uniref:hypothetical protein n=1 Tax=Fortiea contorta TaxID=1892405 RepID=UPI00034B7AB6|nr:hypothetical protein [Fortiea contorta]